MMFRWPAVRVRPAYRECGCKPPACPRGMDAGCAKAADHLGIGVHPGEFPGAGRNMGRSPMGDAASSPSRSASLVGCGRTYGTGHAKARPVATAPAGAMRAAAGTEGHSARMARQVHASAPSLVRSAPAGAALRGSWPLRIGPVSCRRAIVARARMRPARSGCPRVVLAVLGCEGVGQARMHQDRPTARRPSRNRRTRHATSATQSPRETSHQEEVTLPCNAAARKAIHTSHGGHTESREHQKALGTACL